MTNSLTVGIRIVAIFAVIVCTAVSSLAQLTLRKALDYDGDGKADYAIFRPSDSNWYIYKSGGTVTIQNWGLPTDDFFTPGDYDGDGKADMAVFRNSNGVWYWLNSSNNTVSIVSWGISGDEPVARDYDGDGKTDVAVVRRINGAMIWYVYRSSDAQIMIVNWGIPTDFTAPGDYDGDGKFDFCVQRPGPTPSAQATIYAYLSGGGVTITSWGLGTDEIVPGDYDGDGKTDLAVVRPGSTPDSELRWFILNSSSGAVSIYDWGATGTDLSVQNDYDGDGKTDPAVWRDSTGDFWIIKSTGGTDRVNWGISNDFPIAGYDTH